MAQPSNNPPQFAATSINVIVDNLHYYRKQLDAELDKQPWLLVLEQQTNVPKAYLVSGGAAFVFLLIFLNFAGALVCNLVGLVYPAYASFQALQTTRTDDDQQWLTYWIVFACFGTIEFFSDLLLYWMPFYYLFKASFLLYLYLPQTRGAQVLYVRFIQPALTEALKKSN